MTTEEKQHIDRLDQRQRYLLERIRAKRLVGWETVYDESEHAALMWALDQIRLFEDADLV